MSMFTLTSQQLGRGLTDYNNYMSQIDAMRRRAGDRFLRENPAPLKKAPNIPSAGALGGMPTTRNIAPPAAPAPSVDPNIAAEIDAGQGSDQFISRTATTPATDPKAWDRAVVGPDKARLVGGLKVEDGRYTGEIKAAPPDPNVSPARQMVNKLVGEGATGNVRTRLRMSGFFNPVQRFFTADPEKRAQMDLEDKAVDWLDSNAGAAWVNANPQALMEIWNRGGSVIDVYNTATGGKPTTSPAAPAPVPAPAPAPATAPITTNANVPKFSTADEDLLARIVQAEAGNQSEEGKQAVAATIINRLNSGQYGNTLQSVLTAAGQFQPVTAVGGDLSKLKRANIRTKRAVRQLLQDFSANNPVGNALFFQNPAASTMIFPSLQPYFNQQGKSIGAIPANSPIKKIGDHIFTPLYNPIPGVPEEDFSFGSSVAPAPAPAPPPTSATPAAGLQTPPVPQQVSQPATQPQPQPQPQPAATEKVIKDNTGATRTMPARKAGVLTDGTKSPTQDAANQKTPKPKILSNWTPAMFNEEFNNGQAVLRSAQYAARVALARYDDAAFQQARVAVDNAATSLENIAVQKGINMFENGGDPRMLMALESQASGTNTIIRPRSDGKYDIEVNGQRKKEGMSRSEVVSMFRRAASQRFTASVNAAQVARRTAAEDSRNKLITKLAEIGTQAQWDAWKKRNEGPDVKTDSASGITYLTSPAGVFAVTTRDPSENEAELGQTIGFDVSRVSGGAFSAAPSGLSIFNAVSGSK
jgi:spore germination cell wall hydrolase CwlJ-like protein